MNLEKKRRFALAVMITIIGIFICASYDAQIIQKVYSLKTPQLTEFFLIINLISSNVLIISVLTLLFLWKDKKRSWILPAWISIAASIFVSFILKISTQRLRPFQQGLVYLLPQLNDADFLTWNFSFPSFQSALVFCTVPMIWKNFPKLRYFWIAFAILVAFSRIYFGLHFLSDVLSGALLGLVIGQIIVLVEQENKFWQRTYDKLFRR